uniref:C-type lectin domain-containing protein n=1 Tax=Cyprinus carpio TaxID=7962 RepID=A0A8C2BRF3_CYPCA
TVHLHLHTKHKDKNHTNKHLKRGSDGVKIRSSRAAGVCLGLLCVLLLTAVIILCVTFTRERQQFISTTENLTRERDQLKHEKNYLWSSLCKVDGWKCYQSSLYFISSETKNWTESRRYCRERAADLIIINNTEEQDFVKIVSGGSEVWIGLTDIEVEGRWKWDDGSTLTSEFWESEEPNSYQGKEEDCAITRSSGWADFSCDYMSKWICEKSVLK